MKDWHEELPQIALATKGKLIILTRSYFPVSMDLLRPRLGNLSKGVRDITVMLRDYNPIDPYDTFTKIMQPFLETCAERTKMVERDFDRMEREYKVRYKISNQKINLGLGVLVSVVN